MRRILKLFTCVCLFVPSVALAQIRITEWEYNGLNNGDAGEYIELMNIGNSPIDMTGWSFHDFDGVPGSFSISGFGVVQPKEIVIIAEATAAAFRAAWGLPESVKVVGENDENLGRNDRIHIFDDTGTLVDRLYFGDQDYPGTIRTNGLSGNPLSIAALGANDVALWKRSLDGDEYGSYTSTEGNIGNPGIFTLIPEPSSLGLLLLGVAGLSLRRRIRWNNAEPKN